MSMLGKPCFISFWRGKTQRNEGLFLYRLLERSKRICLGFLDVHKKMCIHAQFSVHSSKNFCKLQIPGAFPGLSLRADIDGKSTLTVYFVNYISDQ